MKKILLSLLIFTILVISPSKSKKNNKKETAASKDVNFQDLKISQEVLTKINESVDQCLEALNNLDHLDLSTEEKKLIIKNFIISDVEYNMLMELLESYLNENRKLLDKNFKSTKAIQVNFDFIVKYIPEVDIILNKVIEMIPKKFSDLIMLNPEFNVEEGLKLYMEALKQENLILNQLKNKKNISSEEMFNIYYLIINKKIKEFECFCLESLRK
jgi:hypothetical protein